MINIETLPIILIKDIKREYFTIPKTKPLNYAPIIDIDRYHYPIVSLIKKDPVCYIKHKTQDLWLYQNINGDLEFTYLQRNHDGFEAFIQPLFFFINYLEVPTFIMYRPVRFNSNYFMYLVCDINIDNKINLYWTDKIQYATRFTYDIIKWKEYLYENIPAKILFTKDQLLDVDPYIMK